MKTLRTKLTIASLAAIALCIARPAAGQAQQPAKTDAPTTPPAAEQHDNTPQPAAAKPVEKTPPTSEAKAGTRAESGAPQPAAKTAATATSAKNVAANAGEKPAAAGARPEQAQKPQMAQRDQPQQAKAAPPPAPAVPGRPLRIASKSMKEQTADKLAGSTVRGRDGKRLGEVKDFLVDTESGNIAFAVVSSGGAFGIGDKLRLVPFAALRRTGSDNKFGVDLDEAQWKQLATVDEKAIDTSSITFSDAQRRRIEQPFSPKADASSAYYTAGISEHLVSARSLEGRKVRSGNGGAGTIEGVVIESGSRQATVLLDPRRGFLGTSQKFLVPLEQLSISGGKRPQIAMAFTADDFRATQTGKRPAGTADQQVAAKNQSAANTKVAAASGNTPASGTAAQPPKPAANQKESSTAPAVAAHAAKPSAPPQSQPIAPVNAPKQQVASTDTPSATAKKSANDEHPAATGSEKDSKDIVAKSDAGAKTKSQQDERKPAVTSTPESQDVAAAAPKKTPAAGTANAAATSTAHPQVAADEPREAKDKANAGPTNATGKPAEKLASATSSPSAVREDQPDSSDKQTGKSTNVAANDEHPRTPPTVDGKSPAQTVPNPQSPSRSENLSPTGRTSAEQTPDADPTLLAAARAVRKALDEDPEVARAAVRVTPENKKLMLRGSVKSEDEKQTIEQLAKKAAQGQAIESEISVGTK